MKLRLCLLLLLTVGWLLPLLWCGAIGALPVKLPARIAHQYTISRLFPKRSGTWTQVFIQLRSEEHREWFTLDTRTLSPTEAFGYRQRLDLTLQFAHGKKVESQVRQHMAVWIAQNYAALHPEDGKVTGVRFGQASWAGHSEALAAPSGHWEPYPAELPESVSMRWDATYAVNGERAVLQAPTAAPSAKQAVATSRHSSSTTAP